MTKRNYLITFVRFNNSPMSRFITISKGTEFLRIPADHLVFISADGNYSNVVTRDGKSALVSFQLGQVEDLIADQLGDGGGQFIRLGRGLIINIHFVYRIDIATQQLVLSDCNGCYHELSASREVLIKLKAYLETLMKLENE
jgi:DNA-binding LytR/AlgR family response regulator